MQVHYSADQLPELPSPVVTMGSFDGVHAGHRVIIRRLRQLAKEAGGCSVLLTFSPHPRKVLYPDTKGKNLNLISSLEEKIQLLEETGLDHLIVMEFTLEFSRTSSEQFVRDFLVGCLHAHTIVVGFNHYFGHNKEGSYDSLYRVGEEYGFRVEEIPEQEIQNETVSSTKIRRALEEGHIQRANAYLEHFFLMQAELRREVSDSKQDHDCLAVELRNPDKLLPPTGMYAISCLAGEVYGKALVRIEGAGILLYTLKGEPVPGEGPGHLFFHKHLDETLIRDVASAQKAVEELIY